MSGVRKYVYNSKRNFVQKRLKKELIEKICPKKLNFCWFLKPFAPQPITLDMFCKVQ